MIEPVEMFSAICDTCKDVMELFGGYTAMPIESEVKDEIKESDWNILEDGKCYCPDCHSSQWDNEGEDLFAYTKDGKMLGKIDF